MAAISVAACRRTPVVEKASSSRETPTVDAPRAAPSIELDPYGKAMLEPSRADIFHPTETVERLRLSPDAVVADIGAGPGFLTLPLARAVPRGRVIATDVRQQYLDATLARARDAGLENVEVRLAPAERSGLEPASIDLAVLSEVDQHLPNRVLYFKELQNALRPGGRIAIINLHPYHSADLDLAAAASLDVIDAWEPSQYAFVLLLAPHAGH